MIVEDVLDQLDLYEMVLNDAGYRVVRATRAATGYDLAITVKPDVIVVDLGLPDLDGWALCDLLRTSPATATVPIIILTARDEYDIPLRAARANAAILHKPCPVERLTAAIVAAIGRRG